MTQNNKSPLPKKGTFSPPLKNFFLPEKKIPPLILDRAKFHFKKEIPKTHFTNPTQPSF